MTDNPLRNWDTRIHPIPRRELGALRQVGDPGRMGKVFAVEDAQPPCFYKEYEEPFRHVKRLTTIVGWRWTLPADDLRVLDKHCAWPLVMVTDDNGQVIGFLMRPAPPEFWISVRDRETTLELAHLTSPPDRAQRLGIPVPDQRQRLELLAGLADIFGLFEKHGIVYGDFSEKNVLWTLRGGPGIFLIDCDNARPDGMPEARSGVATTMSALWRDPAGPAGLSSDHYALAMFGYRVCCGVRGALARDADGRPVLDLPDAPVSLKRLLRPGLGLNAAQRPLAADWGRAARAALAVIDGQEVTPIDSGPEAPPPFVIRWISDLVRLRPRLTTGWVVAALIVLMLLLIIPLTAFRSPPSSGASTLSTLAAEPVKLSVQEYAALPQEGVGAPEGMDFVVIHVALRNGATQPLDMANARKHLVLITDRAGNDATPAVGTAGSLHLYAVQAAGATFSAGTLAPGESAPAAGLTGGSAAYLMAPAGPQADARDVTLAALHVVGVAWLADSGQILGFSPVAAWKGDTGVSGMGAILSLLTGGNP